MEEAKGNLLWKEIEIGDQRGLGLGGAGAEGVGRRGSLRYRPVIVSRIQTEVVGEGFVGSSGKKV